MKKLKHLLENLIEEILVGTLIAGCAVGSFVKNMEIKKPTPIERKVAEFHQGEIPGISLGDTFLLEPYVAPEKPEPKYLTNAEIDSLLDKQYKKIKLPDYISKDYVKALIKQESGNNPEAVSSWGARGLLQLLEPTWYDYENSSYDEAFNSDKNTYVGLKHLKQMDSYCSKNYPNYLELSNEEKQDILSTAYNVGIGKFERKNWDISKMPRETRKHVKKIREELDENNIGS